MRLRFSAAVAALSAVLSTDASAGPQYVDGTGFAISGYDAVAYFDLGPVTPGGASPAPVPGRADVTATYNGAAWAFASEANRQRFLADPAAYAPAYDGHCSFGVAQGNKVPGSPALWHIVDGRLYLNLNTSIDASWQQNVQGYIVDAETNWDRLETDAPSDDPVPRFDISAAPRR